MKNLKKSTNFATLENQLKQIVQSNYSPIVNHFIENETLEDFDLDEFTKGFDFFFQYYFSIYENNNVMPQHIVQMLQSWINLFSICTFKINCNSYQLDSNFYYEFQLSYKNEKIEKTCFFHNDNVRNIEKPSISFLFGYNLFKLFINTSKGFYNVEEILKTLNLPEN